jgi:hypothetical protein
MANKVTIAIGEPLELLLLPASGHCIVRARLGAFTATATGFEMAYTLPARMQIQVRVDYVDAAGNPAAVGDVTWDSSASNIISVTVDANDSQQCTIVAPGTLGTAQITATADADIGTGVRTLVTTIDVSVVAGEAVAGTISPVGEVQPIPCRRQLSIKSRPARRHDPSSSSQSP